MGRRYPDFKFFISELWARDYKRALGYGEAEINDPEFIPPTFVSCLRDGNFNAFAALGIELSQLLHAGQSYRYFGALRTRDLINCSTEISRVLSKKGRAGEMVLIDFKTVFSREKHAGQKVEPHLVAESSMSVVVRNPT